MRGLDLPESVVNMVADRLTCDVRKLHGALNRLQAYTQAHGKAISVELALDALAELFRAETRNVNLGDIEKAICDVFGVDAQNLKSSTKSRRITQARQLAMWLCAPAYASSIVGNRRALRSPQSQHRHFGGKESQCVAIGRYRLKSHGP